MDTDYLVILVAVADAEAGVALGRKLVEEGLAACVQVLPGGTAIYRWQGKINSDAMAQLIIKTRRRVWPAAAQPDRRVARGCGAGDRGVASERCAAGLSALGG